jgi:hypothetical protein
MAKSPDEIVADIDRKQNEEDKDLIPRAGRTVVGAAKKIYDAATGKGAEDFQPKTAYQDGNFSMPNTEPVRSPVDVGAGVRSLNMGKKSAVGSEGIRSGLKKGGKVKSSSASKRADGIAQRGKTKGKYL